MAAETPWVQSGGDSMRGTACTPRPRERLWTLVKGARRIDAELLFQAEAGVEVQFAHEGVMAYAQRFVLREQAVQEADAQRARLLREGWMTPATSPPIPSEPPRGS